LVSALVVVIPGIGGSLLDDPTKTHASARLVWYGGLGCIADTLLDPERLAIDRPLRPVGLVAKFTVVPWFKNIDGYTTVWSSLTSRYGEKNLDRGHPDHPNLDARVLAFPYDFRLGVDAAADTLEGVIATRLRRLGRDTQLVLVGHSMGGLVARRWVARYGHTRQCRAVITLGTPHGGAPKALDVAINGLRWGPLERRKLSEVVRTWPSIFDLVGTEARVQDPDGTLRPAHEIAGMPFARQLSCAATMHREIRDSWEHRPPTIGPLLLPVAGAGHATWSQSSWDGEHLSLLRSHHESEPLGDATVPYWSAVPSELAGPEATERTRRVGDRHGALAAPAGLTRLLDAALGVDPPVRGGLAMARPEVGLDLVDLVEPGSIVTGAVLVDGEPTATQHVSASLEADGERVGLCVEPSDANGFIIKLPDETRGELRVKARVQLSGDDSLDTAETVAVVE
jgi:pimeloyl-ACP methyl ester carboxylesterase